MTWSHLIHYLIKGKLWQLYHDFTRMALSDARQSGEGYFTKWLQGILKLSFSVSLPIFCSLPMKRACRASLLHIPFKRTDAWITVNLTKTRAYVNLFKPKKLIQSSTKSLKSTVQVHRQRLHWYWGCWDIIFLGQNEKRLDVAAAHRTAIQLFKTHVAHTCMTTRQENTVQRLILADYAFWQHCFWPPILSLVGRVHSIRIPATISTTFSVRCMVLWMEDVRANSASCPLTVCRVRETWLTCSFADCSGHTLGVSRTKCLCVPVVRLSAMSLWLMSSGPRCLMVSLMPSILLGNGDIGGTAVFIGIGGKEQGLETKRYRGDNITLCLW